MLEAAVLALLTACRDRLAQGVMAAFMQHLDRVKDEFLSMADHAATLEQQQICFAALNLLANRAPALVERFQRVYAARFDASVTALHTPPPAAAEFTLPDELSLIDPDDFERDLAINKLSSRAAFHCSQHLVALDRRLAILLQMQRLSQDDNPLYPATIFNALLQTLIELDLERTLALPVLQAFERHTAAALPELYAALNRHLAAAGVLPMMPEAAPAPASATSSTTALPTGSRPSASTASGAAPPARVGHGASSGSSAFSGAGEVAEASEDVFSQLLQAIQVANRTGAAFAPAPAVNTRMNMTAAAAPLAPPRRSGVATTVSVHQLLDALGQMQHGRAEVRTVPSVEPIALALEQDDVLQQFRATPLAQWSHPLDAMTIDIVSMLFEAIFNDPELPAPLRAEIAKLQIPVLKVALLDKRFFSERKHPARRLLDTIATAGLGRGQEDEARLTAEIGAVVEAVVSGFDVDIQVFSEQVQRLETFLHAEEQRAQAKAQPVVAQLATAEHHETALQHAVAVLQPRRAQTMPPLIADFLERHWRLVLAAIALQHGTTSAAWQEAVTLMDELIWSVTPKTTAVDRERLLKLLPNLLKRLRQNLEQLQLDEAWEAFFSELIRLHMAALRPDPVPPPPATRPPPAAAMNGAASVAPAVITSPAAVPPPAAEETVPADSDPQLQLVQALEVGAWFEFHSERGTRKTLRLNWISELKRVYLFTNRQGENAMTLAVESLAEHLRKGTARLLSQNPLTDRAVAQVFEKIKPPV
ncbi:hypothetical protein CKO12_09310 [Chromatium okenii]|uniref:DUF1631 domain-containing protein n=1 Tax=Chromatium okenii TaxID=61644 RepID=UPI001903FC02|nr:DUF1631 domain-containing protein [Chromatium okenii]MBK1642068.1 hypothetical protein [Chromatium okenii]